MNRRDLAAAYVLDTLGAADRAKVERRLAKDDELRAEVKAISSLATHLDSLPEEAWPAPDPMVPAPPIRSRRWSVRPIPAVVAMLVVAAVAFGLGAILAGGDSSPTAPTLVLQPLEPTRGEEATVAMPAPGEMVFTAEGLPELEPGQYYEIWLMSSASRLVPVASFWVGPDGGAQVRVPLPAAPDSYRYFDVSRQQVGQGTGHSGVSILRGSTS